MQNDEERRPDLADDSYEETAERVDKLMQGSDDGPKFKTAKSTKKSAKASTPSTAPEIPDLPVPKEPLTIKILKDDKDEPLADEPTNDETDDTQNLVEGEQSLGQDNIEQDKPQEKPESEPDKEPVSAESIEDEDADEDKKLEEAVNDIVAKEGDALLEAEDEKIARAFEPAKVSKWQRFKEGWNNYWADPKKRWITLSLMALLFAAAWALPMSRYFMLNTAGARSKLSVRVLDLSTKQPLKNVSVSAGGATTLTGDDGYARLEKVKLGPTTLLIERVAFAPIKQKITVGWGSNPQGEVQLEPVGVQYSFLITDYLSGKPVEKVEAVNGEASAFSDEDGKVKLTVEKPEGDTIEVVLKGQDLREEKVTIPTTSQDETAVQVVPYRKHVFVSNREGTLDVYSIYIDGKEETKILAGTGSERDDITILAHPSEEFAAVVSTRDNKRNQDGFLLSALTLVDLNNGTSQKITESERVQLVGWVGDRLVFVQVAAGTSAANPKRHRLLSHDFKNNQSDEIAAANYFNDVLLVGNKVFYAPSSTYQSSASNSKLYRVDADGSNRQTVLDKETWNVFRVGFDKLALSVGQEWYDLQVGGDSQPTKLAGPPANVRSRSYIDSPDGQNSLWVDTRDGKGVLLSYQPSSKNELTLRQQSGLRTPVRWASNKVLIYRINTEQETADYALSLDGGDARKIKDVTNSNSTDNWYYY